MFTSPDPPQGLELFLERRQGQPHLPRIPVRQMTDQKILQTRDADNLVEAAARVRIRRRRTKHVVLSFVWLAQESARRNRPPQLRLRQYVKRRVLVGVPGEDLSPAFDDRAWLPVE